MLGGYLLVSGLKKWGNFEEIDLLRAHLEIQNKTNKVLGFPEVSEEEKREESKELIQIQDSNQNKTRNDTHYLVNKILSIEDKIVRQVYETSPLQYKVLSNRQIGNEKYDIVAVGQERFVKDILFEIKYVDKNLNAKILNSWIQQLFQLSDGYSLETNSIPYKKLVIIVNEDIYDKSLRVVSQQKHINNFKIIVLRESDISNTNFFD